jgi:hypothetical protein
MIPAAAEVVLVTPIVGGYGAAHPWTNRVTLEAMLFHPQPAVPETLRLAWLLCQLNSDLPAIADVLGPKFSRGIVALAMVAPVLSAAEAVEAGSCSEGTIAGALGAWRPELGSARAADILWSWWDSWLQQRSRWPVAVAALQQLLAEA